MPTRTKRTKTGRICAISISRLYNTGNYTNVKYDLSCEVAKGESPKATLLEMVRILKALAPINAPDCIRQLNSARKKKLSERSAYEKENYPEWLQAEKDFRAKQQERIDAVNAMDQMGHTLAKDAKDDWLDNDDCPW